MSLKIENIKKSFGTQQVLKGLSFEVEKGEFFFLLGSSGCGKSTLLRIISGLCDPDEGRIFFDGEDVTTLPAEKRGVGLVFQNYALWPHMTVYDNIAFGLQVRKLKKDEIAKKVAKVLQDVRLEGLEKRYPAELSGGQQQRVALARALVVEPKLVLLDEPLSNLDANLRLEMRSELRRIHRELGLTMIYVTHDQKEALSLADRVALLHEGKLEQLGNPTELYKRPQSKFAAGFLGETNFLKGKAQKKNETSWEIETPWGISTISQDQAVGVESGKALSLSVRPEDLRLAGEESAPNFQAKILESNFLGDITQLVLEANGERLLLETLSSSQLRVGELIKVWPKVEDIMAYGE
ncbi:ABC transporter ATP-binding protein [bacterium]|nr:ABC transporter ATP-binding protein [bacterium]